MKKKLLLVLCICYTLLAQGQLQHPDDFLPHKLGEQFTPHYMLVDYFEHVAENSPLVKLVEYGRTREGRPMMVAIVASEENHSRLEDIRLNNLRMAGIADGEVNEELAQAIVWLSYSVHGNEAAGSESSRIVLYKLANPNNAATKEWLENTIVIMDPSVNPDGFSRYTHWIRGNGSLSNNPDINDIEHSEPWPGGRVNHFYFDLNRDWAWQTQIESQQRMVLYNQWLPHVHADLHEMGHESPYYFAPAARPYHKFISKWQQDFQVTIGKNHAKYFDDSGWLYFTKEVFDLFYPSYGDTYPTFSGSIGMTYEQGGSRVGGRAVNLQNGEELTLMDRIDHHRTTSLSTIEISSIHKDQLVQQFRDFFETSSNDPLGDYRTYVVKRDASGNRLESLAELLDRQDIRYNTVNSSKSGEGFSYQSGDDVEYTIEPGDMVISAYQPKSVLTQVLFDPESELEDSLTYDITAWSLPYAYGLESYATTAKIKASSNLQFSRSKKILDAQYGYIIPWADMKSAEAAATLAQNNISYRVASEAVQYGDHAVKAGALLITRADNRSQADDMLQVLRDISDTGATVLPIDSGFANSGPDLGSGKNYLASAPKVLTIRGDRVSAYSFGQIKWYFNTVLNYPLTIVDINNLGRVNLDDYNTIVLPDGFYRLSNMDEITDWVSNGGKLIAIGGANRLLLDNDDFALKSHATSDEKSEEQRENKQADLAARYNHYSEQEREAISDFIPGAIFKLQLDPTHPLAFGLGDSYFSLRTSSNHYPLMTGANNVAYHPQEEGMVLGFAGSQIKEKLNDTVVFAVEESGRGSVIYMVDNPLYRGFWHNGLFLFSNALFIVE